ncbi:PQQ-binding-like beta-propeller repeat protein [Planctomycetota bacterium]|nr:PQQ-binding-like beta-propeller repeat protein [Planctomycetota bacterium]
MLSKRLTTVAICLAAITASTTQLAHAEIKITNSDGAAYDFFGISTAISGNKAIAAASFKNNFTGSAYIFDTNTGIELHKLTAPDANANDVFGGSVDISGNFAAVGATGKHSAYLFDATTGSELHTLNASDVTPSDGFGVSVATTTNYTIVGASSSNFFTGAAYIFDNNTGNELHKLTASDGNTGDNFGQVTDISGNTAIVAAPNASAAYLFDVSSGNELFKLTASDFDPTAFSSFGRSVSISGNVAIVGDADNNSTGAAYLYDVNTGNEITKLTASDGNTSHRFGSSVSISGNYAIVGAQNADGNVNSTGAAYVFDLSTGNEIAKLTASDGTSYQSFGDSVGIDNSTVIIGAQFTHIPGNDYQGAAYIYAIPEPASLSLLAIGSLLLIKRRK